MSSWQWFELAAWSFVAAALIGTALIAVAARR